MVMEELVCQHFSDWNKFGVQYEGLVDPHPLKKILHGELCSHWPGAELQQSMTYRASAGDKYYAGDVVLLGAAHGGACGLVKYHVSVEGVAFTSMEAWPLVASCGLLRTKHRIETSPSFVRSTDLMATAYYRKLSDSEAIVRHPMLYDKAVQASLRKGKRAKV